MLNEIFRISAITLLIVIALQFLRVAKRTRNSWLAFAFTLSIICYLIVEGVGEFDTILFSILLIGPFLIPIFFWLLSKSIFDDNFRLHAPFGGIIIIFLAAHYISYYSKSLFLVSDDIRSLILLIPKLFSFVFMLLGVIEAARNRKFDLIDERLRFRNTFIIVTASLIASTLIVEIISIGRITPEILPTIQKGVIVFITMSFIYYSLELKIGFFLQPDKEGGKEAEVEEDIYNQIELEIRRLLSNEKIYRREGLTVGDLAKVLNVQEYRVRRTINGHMGFRNFNDFLNKYRVQDACTILQDPEKVGLTIQEIAYSLGYQSIGPFNKTFKEQTGLTPTLYRKRKPH